MRPSRGSSRRNWNYCEWQSIHILSNITGAWSTKKIMRPQSSWNLCLTHCRLSIRILGLCTSVLSSATLNRYLKLWLTFTTTSRESFTWISRRRTSYMNRKSPSLPTLATQENLWLSRRATWVIQESFPLRWKVVFSGWLPSASLTSLLVDAVTSGLSVALS